MIKKIILRNQYTKDKFLIIININIIKIKRGQENEKL